MGSDWPFSGLTMVGLERLDDLQACVESVVADGVEGDVIEAGSLARRRIDPRPRDARLAGRRRAHGLGGRLLPGPAGAGPDGVSRGPRARPQPGRLSRRLRGGGAGPLRPLRARAGRRARRGLLRRDAAAPARPALVDRAPRRRHLRGDLGRARIPLPGPVGGRLPDRRRLRPDRRVPRGGRGLPARARDHRADREDRLERRPLATRGRAGRRALGERRRGAPGRGAERSARRGRGRRGRTSPPRASSSWSASSSELRERLRAAQPARSRR